MTDLRGDFIVKTDDMSVSRVAVYSDRIEAEGGNRHRQEAVVRDIEAQLEDWRLCGVPRCILIHNGHKVGELLAAS